MSAGRQYAAVWADPRLNRVAWSSEGTLRPSASSCFNALSLISVVGLVWFVPGCTPSPAHPSIRGPVGFPNGTVSTGVNLEVSQAPMPPDCRQPAAASQREEGILYFNGEGGHDRDLGRALELFREACRCNDPEACFNVGVAYERGWGVTKDPAAARPHYVQACGLGFGAGCFNLGVLLELGIGIDADRKNSFRQFQRGCDLAHAASCWNAGVALRDGYGGVVDLGRARRLFLRACDLVDAAGCLEAAISFELGEGGAPDLDQAATLYQRACDRSWGLCIDLGKFLLSKRGDAMGAHRAFRSLVMPVTRRVARSRVTDVAACEDALVGYLAALRM